MKFQGKRVLLTGHTGFKGAWLAEWLISQGADVTGVALPPEYPASLFEQLALDQRLRHVLCDVRDYDGILEAVKAARPDFVFHLAAQAIVRRGYREPRETWAINVNGTLNVLEALRSAGQAATVVAVTTDKVYQNREWEFPYRETDELGGHDPYSASKAGCELAVASWRASFAEECGIRVVTARAGNVIGPGDMTADRIVPDCFRAWSKGDALFVRNAASTRPWQHVLEPLAGYMALAAHTASQSEPINACNFGPGAEGDRSVGELVRALVAIDPRRQWTTTNDRGPHEARALSLAIDRARIVLGWTPALSFEEAIRWTDEGYMAAPGHLPAVVRRQIAAYAQLIGNRKI